MSLPESIVRHFTALPRRPNCVSSLADRPRQRMEPVPYPADAATTRRRVLNALDELPRVRIVTDEPDFIHAECRSKVLGFVDDLELAFDDQARLVHFRSAARWGIRDFGVNRARIETLFRSFSAPLP